MNKQRSKRIRLLVRKANQVKRGQAKKIDILCNDMVSAHTIFVKQLNRLSFAVKFYESLLGQPDLNSLLNMAAGFIKSNVENSSVAVFLVDSDSFEVHLINDNHPVGVDVEKLESCFTSEVTAGICRSNTICSLDDIFEIGLEGNLTMLSKISAAAVPLRHAGFMFGFILVYRSAENKLTDEELTRISEITSGLCRAIKYHCQLPTAAETNKP